MIAAPSRISDILERLSVRSMEPLPKPPYHPEKRMRHVDDEWLRIGFAVKSMEDHMTNEGWEIFLGLEAAGYLLCGHGIESFVEVPLGTAISCNATDVDFLLKQNDPCTVVIQDKREWEGLTAGPGFNPLEKFTGVSALARRPDVFKLTILKDAHARNEYHRQAAEEIGCHAWIVYYHPDAVCKLAPFVRREHLVRTYHTVDGGAVPKYTHIDRAGCIISGATSRAYPLRSSLIDAVRRQKLNWTWLKHPGYHRRGSCTEAYLKILSRFKVAVCTASIYGYALRKIIEATACGCKVVTDLPEDEVLPEIDENLIRINPGESTSVIGAIVSKAIDEYSPLEQLDYAQKAIAYYDYCAMGKKLASDIETLRRSY